MQTPTFEQWQQSEENQWSHQDNFTQRMMYTMMYRGYEEQN